MPSTPEISGLELRRYTIVALIASFYGPILQPAVRKIAGIARGHLHLPGDSFAGLHVSSCLILAPEVHEMVGICARVHAICYRVGEQSNEVCDDEVRVCLVGDVVLHVNAAQEVE